MSKGYLQPIEAAMRAGLDYTDPDILLQVKIVLPDIEDEVDLYTQTTFINEPGVSKTFNGTGTDMLTLGYYLRTLTSVWMLDVTGAQVEQLLDVVPQPQNPKSGCYRWLQRRQDISSPLFYQLLTHRPILQPSPVDPPNAIFPYGLANIKVTGDWGFAAVPNGIKKAMALAIRHYWNLRDADSIHRRVVGFGVDVENRKPDQIHYLPDASMKLLDKYINSNIFGE